MRKNELNLQKVCDQAFERAARDADKYKDIPFVKSVVGDLIDDFIYHVGRYESVAPVDTPVFYDSYICVFSKTVGDKFSCYSMIVGDKSYKAPCETLDAIKSYDEMLADTYCAFEECKAFLFHTLDMFCQYPYELNTQKTLEAACISENEASSNVTVHKAIYHFQFKEK